MPQRSHGLHGVGSSSFIGRMYFPSCLKPSTRALGTGERLFRQGDPPAGPFRLASGAVRLERRTFDGRLVVIHRARVGEFFAEASMFAEAYHCDAVATEPSRVETVGRDAFLAALSADPGASRALLAHMARQLQGVRQRLELRDVRSARERILLHLDLRADGEGVIRLGGPLQDIAAEVGLTREAAYRALAALERAGAIAREDGIIRLTKRTAI